MAHGSGCAMRNAPAHPNKEKDMTSIKKILLKDESGTARAAMTLRLGGKSTLAVPCGIRPIAYEADGKVRVLESGELPPLPAGLSELSVLAERGGERLFATTRSGEDATLAKWRLNERIRSEKASEKVPTSPLERAHGAEQETDATEKEEIEDVTNEEKSVPPLSAESENALTKAKRLLAENEPFELFNDLMPQSRWAKIETEECLCLIGIVTDGDEEHVLYGVAGTPGYPPDEDKLWTYFPTSDEEGFYLSDL